MSKLQEIVSAFGLRLVLRQLYITLVIMNNTVFINSNKIHFPCIEYECQDSRLVLFEIKLMLDIIIIIIIVLN